MKEIAVVGSGVSGLTSGLCLQQAGFRVEIITDKLPEETTSAKAAAIWFPYEINPVKKAGEWSLTTYRKFEELCQIEGNGVSMVPFIVYLASKEDAWWRDALPGDAVKQLDSHLLPDQFPVGFHTTVPLTETQLYLKYLQNEFLNAGGQLTVKKIHDLNELTNEYHAVINCTGLGARQLLGDREMYPIFGQIIKVDRQEQVTSTSVEMPMGDSEDEIAYLISRSDCMILGGTAIRGKEGELPDSDMTPGIIERCKQMVPELQPVNIQTVVAGLRPGRTSVRLEISGNLIHNYGHGGAGYTVSWGCAYEVLNLVRSLDQP